MEVSDGINFSSLDVDSSPFSSLFTPPASSSLPLSSFHFPFPTLDYLDYLDYLSSRSCDSVTHEAQEKRGREEGGRHGKTDSIHGHGFIHHKLLVFSASSID